MWSGVFSVVERFPPNCCTIVGMTINTNKKEPKVCTFCQEALSNGNQADEHILRKKWIIELGHEKHPILTAFWTGTKSISTRQPIAMSFVAGDICKACNRGWMNQLDIDVDEILMKLAKDLSLEINISDAERYKIARWAIKTACAVEAIGNPARRHIPIEIRSKIHIDGYFPPGYAVFAIKVPFPSRYLGVSQIDVWRNSERLYDLDQSTRFKFAVNYDQVVIICCYASIQTPIYAIPKNNYNFIPIYFDNGASFLYIDSSSTLENLYASGALPKEIYSQLSMGELGRILFEIEVW